MEVSKKLPKFLEISKKFEEAEMSPGDVSIRRAFDQIVPPPHWGDREGWFFNLSRQTGLPMARLKSLFYDRRCRMWGSEATRIKSALSRVAQSQNHELSEAIDRNAETRQVHAELDRLKGELKLELLEDIRALLLELHGSGAGVPVRAAGKAIYSR